MDNDPRLIYPGDRVLVFDHLLYVNDIKTPKSVTMKPATVICRYGYRSEYNSDWIYPDCIAIKFDHCDEISYGHFTNGVEILK